jgi:hypothetical protein
VDQASCRIDHRASARGAVCDDSRTNDDSCAKSNYDHNFADGIYHNNCADSNYDDRSAGNLDDTWADDDPRSHYYHHHHTEAARIALRRNRLPIVDQRWRRPLIPAGKSHSVTTTIVSLQGQSVELRLPSD